MRLFPYNSFLALFVVSQVLLCGVANALTITGVSHSPTYFEPKNSSKVAIRYTLDQPAQVILRLFDDRDILIKKLSSSQAKKNENMFYWDGTDYNGKKVPAEAYRYTLEATTASENVAYDVSDTTGNKSLDIINTQWDKAGDKISYLINKPSRISIRVGIDQGGPLLATVTDWLPRGRGEHSEQWNGMDTAHEVNIERIPNTVVHTRAYTLSSNTIVVGPYSNKSMYVNIDDEDVVKRVALKKNWKKFDYLSKKAKARSDYTVGIKLPDDPIETINDVPVFKGTIPIKITLQADDIERMQLDRFESMLFIDGKYVSELETGFSPLTWRLDTSLYTEGEHFITVNLRGYDGQFGVTSRNLYIRH